MFNNYVRNWCIILIWDKDFWQKGTNVDENVNIFMNSITHKYEC